MEEIKIDLTPKYKSKKETKTKKEEIKVKVIKEEPKPLSNIEIIKQKLIDIKSSLQELKRRTPNVNETYRQIENFTNQILDKLEEM